MTVLNIEKINKSFEGNHVIRDFSLTVKENDFVVIRGKSGCGKSTLLNMIGLLDKPDDGKIELFGYKNTKPFSNTAQKLLKDKVGYLFQNFALIENKSVRYNLELVLKLQKGINKEEKIKKALHQVGLDGYEEKKIYKCSGGEQQRIAIARLLLKPCELVLADEPTGSLDAENRDIVIRQLLEMQKQGKTIIIVTHDPFFDQYASCLKTL